MKDIERILCPVDMSTTAQNALRYALRLADKWDVPIQVLYILPPQVEGFDVPLMVAVSTREVIEHKRLQLSKWVSQTITQVQASYEFDKAPVLYEVVELGTPVSNILSFIKAQRTDLVVIGTKEKHNWLERVVGTVSGAIVRRPICPVLLIPEGARFRTINRLTYATTFSSSDPYFIWKTLQLLEPFIPAVDCVHLFTDEEEVTELKGKDLEDFFTDLMPNYSLKCYNFQTSDIPHGLENFTEIDRSDLLVMHKPKENVIHRLFYRSETQQTALVSKVPLLVIV